MLMLTLRSTEVFSVPTKQFIAYESKTWLPYFIKRHIFRKNIPKPPPIIEKGDKVDSPGMHSMQGTADSKAYV
jgi:hypothetical protein